jgi:enoyl-CoA hydratase/carnithine racemase
MSNLIASVRDHIAYVTINRPDARNALSKETNEELATLAAELGNNSEVRAVVLRGSGEKSFCAGADLKERKGVSPADTGPYVDAISGAITAWSKIPQPTLAVVNGFAFGGGMELAIACDLRIAADNALFGLTEVRLGIMPGAGGTQRLPRLIGVSAAKELILLGKRIDAKQALGLGLVSAVVPQSELDSKVDEIVAELMLCAPLSTRMAKEAIDRGTEVGIEEGLQIERACYEKTLFTEDRNEGLRAFAEKRAPKYQGR